METKKVLAVITTVALIGAVGVTSAFAANNTKGNFNKERLAMDDAQRPGRVELTEEQKAERLVGMKEKLAQQLADGKITQEKYDEMIAAIENGEMPMLDGSGMRRGRPAADGECLEFDGERPELTDEQKAEMEAKRSDMLEQRKAKLAQDLADSKITQEQYDEIIAAMEEGKMPMGRGMNGCGKGGMGAHGEMGKQGGRMGNRQDKATDTVEV